MSFGSPYVTLPDFTYHRPKTLEEALGLLKEHGDEAKVENAVWRAEHNQ